MAAPESPVEPLAPDVALRLAEFAKACRAAARIVSMYPPTHPAIQAALTRIADAGKQVTDNGPCAITVLPDSLMVSGRGFAKPDAAIAELAGLLHQQLIAEMTVFDRLDNESWHAFLTLVAKPLDESRAMGGIVKAWEQTGNKTIHLREIDYAQVLRESSGSGGGAATWDRILAALKHDGHEGPGGSGGTMQDLIALADDPQQLADFAQRMQDAARDAGEDSLQQRKALVDMMHGLANFTADREPAALNGMLEKMAAAAARLPPDLLLALITEPPPIATGSGSQRLDLARELQSRLTDEMISRFLVENIARDRGATSRLAAAFRTLVPDEAKQQDILSSASTHAAAMFKDDPQFANVWASSTAMLMSYSDAKFVPESYARELTLAQSQAMEVEKIGDDSPARIRTWVATISENELRALDQRLLLDLLTIEKRPEPWASVLDTAIHEIDALVLVGDLRLAAQLLETIMAVSRDNAAPFKDAAAAGITKLVAGPMVRHLATFLRQANDAEFGIAKQMCAAIGPVLVRPMSDAIMGEENPKTVRRLRDILISFGPDAREYANELRISRNPAVRRAAVDLLRALGGDAALPDLRTMLDDTDPQVQRESLRGIIQLGTPAAYKVLEQALQSGAKQTRDMILQALGAFRDEKAAPLFLYMLGHTSHTGQSEAIYTQTIESLGRVANDERSSAALKDILYRGEWWAPSRTARIRMAAARALRMMAHPSAERVLEEAAIAGPGGARKIAKAVLAEPAPIRRAVSRGAAQ